MSDSPYRNLNQKEWEALEARLSILRQPATAEQVNRYFREQWGNCQPGSSVPCESQSEYFGLNQ